MSRRSKGKSLTSSTPVPLAGETPGAASSSTPQSKNRLADRIERWIVPGVCIFLAVIIWTVFGQTLHHEFFNFDDDDYVYQNPEVIQGLTLNGIIWAFTRVHSSNWHPLTWISHMLDCQFYGLNPAGHHLTNVLLHTATAILLFLALRRMTGFLWRSAFVAAMFAVHPLRVESVAWIAERKDVLSGVFFMLTIGAYVRYARRPWSPARYGLVLLLFAAGLMCKPMLVTLPFVLLLLDYWPLNLTATITDGSNHFPIPRRLILDKLPLLGLAAASGVATLFAQTEAIQPPKDLPLLLHVGNAVISYAAYLGQMFRPSGLAAFYPYPVNGLPFWEVIRASVLLLTMTAGVFVLRKTRPYLMTGWLWYLVMLLPVIGVLQVGSQAMADRYTYLPQIGVYLLLTWAVADLCAVWRHRRMVLGGGALIILVALMFCARTQTSYWRNSESLWTHTLACTSGNFFAHNNLANELLLQERVDEAIVHCQSALQIKPDCAEAHVNLGNALLKQDKLNEAITHFQTALEIRPDFVEPHNNLGSVFLKQGKLDEAIVYFQKALEIKSDNAAAHYNLGNAFSLQERTDEAITQYQKALEINPTHAEAHYNLGNILLQQGRIDEAITHYQKALVIKSNYAEALCNLGVALNRQGRTVEAIAHYQKALAIKPDYADALNNLARVLATCPQAALRNGSQAVELARRANQLAGGENPVVLCTLAAAWAEAGQFTEAITNAQHALSLAEAQSNPALADSLQSQLKLYQAGLPFHMP